MIIQSLLISLLSPAANAANCIPAREAVQMPHSGQYHRVHPSGNFVLYSTGRGVKIADITDRANPKEIFTPMKAETYPVESATGGWDLVASPYDVGGMNYYQFKDILKDQDAAKSVFKDKENDQYYHSSAELPGSTADVRKVRTLLYGQTHREYTMTRDTAGNFTKVEAGPARQQMCSSFVNNNETPLDRSLNAEDTARRAELTQQQTEARARSEAANNRYFDREQELSRSRRRSNQYTSQERRELEALGAEARRLSDETSRISRELREYANGSAYRALSTQLREVERAYHSNSSPDARRTAEAEYSRISALLDRYRYGNSNEFRNPILSKDGTLVAAGKANGIAVYKILPDKRCELIAETGFAGSKVSFSYPVQGKLPKLTFTSDRGPSGNNERGAYVYDLETKNAKFIGQAGEYASYPGFTKDGRVIYASNGSGRAGFTIVDPNQVPSTDNATCIKAASRDAPSDDTPTDAPANSAR